MLLLVTNVISEVRKSTCHPNVQAWMAARPTDTLYISSITVLEIQRGISQAAQRGTNCRRRLSIDGWRRWSCPLSPDASCRSTTS